MLAYGGLVLVFMLPAILFLKPPPKAPRRGRAASRLRGVRASAIASPAFTRTWRRR